MKILHISLNQQGKDYVSMHYFWDKPAHYQEHRLPLTEIKQLTDRADTDYYTRLAVDYATTGQALYNWLDKSDRVLANALKEPHPQGLIIAIAASEGLAHLPWEVLHDGQDFLVKKRPSIIPIRWVSNGKPITSVITPQNRPLNVLFMATSPSEVEPELDYEAEEGRILEATRRTRVNLQVEESGNLDELTYVVRAYSTENEKSYFDVVHLTGHASSGHKKPYFLTEDEYGNRVYSSTDAIADALKDNSGCLPPLIFLSSCRTGYSSSNAVPSMAEELLNMGATAVLGWGERVRDSDATAVAGQLYKELSIGGTVAQAMTSIYQTLIEQQAPDWHKLRLYVADTLPEALVTSLNTRGRKQLPKLSTTIVFRDDEQRLRVATRENFVGRRRQLQNCLRTLKTDDEKVGVLIYGMGGWGKSSIASRLWDRLPEHEQVLWWQQIDESTLIKKLSSKLIKPELREIRIYLEATNDDIDVKLTYLFSKLAELGEKPFLLILDDFEWNLEPRAGRYTLKPEVAPILSALVLAIQKTGSKHRIIITCRYDFYSDLLEYFYKQGLEPLRKTELTKKLNRLEYFNSDKIPEDIRERALILADGNPRLLEFLNNEILGKKDVDAQIKELEQSPERWKDKIIWEKLYQLIDEPLQQILSYCLVYEIRVPMVFLEAVCDGLTNYQQQLQRGLNLGLIEISSEVEEKNRVYRVSRILPQIIPSIQLPSAPKVYSLYQKAHEKMHEFWGYYHNRSEEIWREIFRLKFANRENAERFRQGFSQMMAIQYQKGGCDEQSDDAFKFELIKVAGELKFRELYTQLENYLKQKQWKEADEETAWIFYQIMVKENHKGWGILLKNFPIETFKEINRLWVENSNNNFGISIQMEIYQSLGGTEIEWEGTKNYGEQNKFWDEFCDRVGWRKGGYYLKYDEIVPKTDNTTNIDHDNLTANGVILPALPVLIYTRRGNGGFLLLLSQSRGRTPSECNSLEEIWERRRKNLTLTERQLMLEQDYAESERKDFRGLCDSKRGVRYLMYRLIKSNV